MLQKGFSMRIDVFTLFPNLVDAFCSESLLGRARNEKIVDFRCHDLREHTTDVHLSLLCGRYEGIDHRIREHLIDEEVSVGDVVLAGGEVGACLIIEAVTRLLPGVMGNAVSPITESFGQSGLLEEPHFTRPADFRGFGVPEVLRGGNHAQIERWRLAQALHRTIAKRPDLMAKRGPLTQTEQRLLEEFPPVPYPSHFTI